MNGCERSGCERFEELIERYVAEDIEPADLEALDRHLEGCSACRGLVDLHRELSEIHERAAYVTDQRFGEMRASVLKRIKGWRVGQVTQNAGTSQGVRSAERACEESSKGHGAVRHGGQPFWKRWPLALAPRSNTRPAFAIASVVILLALGFVAGRLTSGQGGFNQDSFVKEVVRQASQERGLSGYWDSPFTYSNVSFRPHDDGTFAIDFDVARHVSVTGKLESPMTRELLVHAMIDPTAMGSRLNAMSVASEAMEETADGPMDGALRETLIMILKNDPSMPVRLKALEILAPQASEADVRDALLAVLAQDPSVQIRLLAVECLAGKHTNPELIKRALGEPRNDSDRAVLRRAVELLGDI